MGETGFTRAQRLIKNLKEKYDFISMEDLRGQIRLNLTMNEATITQYLHLMSDMKLIQLQENKVILL